MGPMIDVKGQSTWSASKKQVGCLAESEHRRDTKVMFGCRLYVVSRAAWCGIFWDGACPSLCRMLIPLEAALAVIRG